MLREAMERQEAAGRGAGQAGVSVHRRDRSVLRGEVVRGGWVSDVYVETRA